MGLDQHVDTIAKVAEVAGKEFSIEQVSKKLIYQPVVRCFSPASMYFLNCDRI